ncbi:MAG: BACON domain-containing protein, partial [Fretibacterium sp.]|nr:BACON domain-containing protein [Fretibacterium sp.]
EKAADVLSSLTARDIVFLGNADEDLPEAEDAVYLDFFAALLTAYNNGAAMVAVYPDSGDVKALNELLGTDIDLASPDQEAEDPHFELLGAARRTLPNGSPHIFVYLDDSDSNEGESGDKDPFYNVLPESGDLNLTSDVNGDTHDGDTSAGGTELTTNEVEAALHASRVQSLLEWSAGLDEEARNMGDEVAEAEAKLRAAADSGKDILSLASGVTTTQADNVSWSFKDYYEKFGKKHEYFKVFADKCDFDNPRLLNKYWSGFKVSRHTFSRYRVVSVHSFENDTDYYLVISEANTQPGSLAIRADKGKNNGGEVPGAGAYNYAVILGYTKGLYTDVQRVYKNGDLVRHTPNQTVNRGKSYTESDGWTLGGGLSFKGGINDKGLSGEAGVNFSTSVSHTSSTTWQGQDYQIIPKPSDNWRASWLLDVDYPDYKKGWHISTAAESSVTLNTESIWKTTQKGFALKGRACWVEGFAWCHDTLFGDSWYKCGVTQYGSWKTLSLPRPPRIALEKTSEDGGKEGKMYSTKLYTEDKWSAAVDKSAESWIKLEASSGSKAAGQPFYYTVSPNETGKIRTGYITVTSGRDKVTLKFVQSPYSK